jgi:hypothetical protein
MSPSLPNQLLSLIKPNQFSSTHLERVNAQQARDELQNSARTTLLQGLGGTAVLLGVYFTFRQLRIARQGQVTERFTRAVDQLGSTSEDVQLGGIYALQQISLESREERGAIHEILASYVRSHAPWPEPEPKPDWRRILGVLMLGQRAGFWKQPQDPYDTDPVDVDAVERSTQRSVPPRSPSSALSNTASRPRRSAETGSRRAEMVAWVLAERAAGRDPSGADLDARFGTSDYGRRVLREEPALNGHYPQTGR